MGRAATTFVLAAVTLATMLVGCDANLPDRRQQTDQLTQQIGTLPSVASATDTVADSVAEGLVYAEVHVRLADGATPDLVAAVTTAYLDHLRNVDYSGYRTELDIVVGASTFVVDNGRRQIANDQQVVQQARDWMALLPRYPGGAVTLHAAAVPDQPAAGRVELADAATSEGVSTAFTTLAATAPYLAAGHWIVSAAKEHPVEITTTGRWPNDVEMQTWQALNADQSIPHADSMTINGATTGPLWIGEVTQSRDPAVALQLARQHLPIVARLPAPVLYTATESWSGHLDATGQATTAVAVTVGGCSKRTYRTTSDEQALINAYETCKH